MDDLTGIDWLNGFKRKFSKDMRKYQYARKHTPPTWIPPTNDMQKIKAQLRDRLDNPRKYKPTIADLKKKYPDPKFWNITKYLRRLLSGSSYNQTPWFSDSLDKLFLGWFK